MRSIGRRKGTYPYFRTLCVSQMSSLASLSNIVLSLLATKTEKAASK